MLVSFPALARLGVTELEDLRRELSLYSQSAFGTLVCTRFSPLGSGYIELLLEVELLELEYLELVY